MRRWPTVRLYVSTALVASLAGVMGGLGASTPVAASPDTSALPSLYSETFEAVAVGAIPAGWSQGANNGVGADWQVVASTPGTPPQGIAADHTATGPGRFLGHDDAAGNDQKEILSAPIDLSLAVDPYLEFWLYSFLASGNSTFNTNRVTISVVPTTGPTTTVFEMGDTDLTAWQEFTVRLAPWVGQSVRLRINFDGALNSAIHDIGLDDIRVVDVGAVPIVDGPLASPVALTFFTTVPENHVQSFHRSIRRAGLTCAAGEANPIDSAQDPITSTTSITVADDGAVIVYDHWEDGFGPTNRRTQWSTEVWGDGNLTNGIAPGSAGDVLNAGSVITLQNRVDPDTLASVLDYDGGDRITTPNPIVITRLGWSDGSSTLMAGATEVFDLGYYGDRFVVPVGTDSPVQGQLFQHTAASITASRNGTVVTLPASVGGGTVTLAAGQSHLTSGALTDGDVITATQPITVSLLAGDVCSNYETDWFTLLPTRLWDNEYYTPVFSSDTTNVPTQIHLFNPTAATLTVSYRFGTGAVQTVSVPAQGVANIGVPQGAATAGAVGRIFTTGGQLFYALQSYDTGDSAQDWGYGLLPADQLSPVLQAGYAPGADPTVITTQNVSPLWVGVVWRGAGAAPAAVTLCVDWNGDASPGAFDATVPATNLQSLKLKDPDGNNSAARIFVCNPANPTDPAIADWGLVGAWGQESQAPGASPSIDVGTGILNLPSFNIRKTVSRVLDDNNNGVTDVGDTVEYQLVVTNTSAIQIRANTLQVLDNPPTSVLDYVAGSTLRTNPYPTAGTPPAAAIAIADDVVGPAATTINPLDDPDTSPWPPLGAADVDIDGVDDGWIVPVVLPGRNAVTITFRARILNAPANNVIFNTACVTDSRFLECDRVPIALPEFGSIGDRVWLDEDGDGVQDAGETGIPGVTVRLTPPPDVDLGAGPGVAVTTVTDADGGYVFRDLPIAAYTVTIVAPAGLDPTFDADGGLDNSAVVVLAPPAGGASTAEVSTADFGLNWVPPANTDSGTGVGALGDRVWFDADGDGAQDPGEAGAIGAAVTLLGDPDGNGVYDTVIATVLTAADGRYIFDDLAPGAYVVSVAAPAGTTQTGDPDGTLDNRSEPIVIAPGDVYVNADFGYRPAAGNTIGDRVWLDSDGDGVVDAAEPGFAGVSVVLLGAAGNVVATAITDATGTYAFTGVPDGTYTVWVNDSGNVLREYEPISNPAGDGTLDNRTSVTVSGGATVATADFGYAPPNHDPAEGFIGDTVFLDRNGNGAFDPGEGLEGVRVELLDEAGRLVGVAFTNEHGSYGFGDVAAGTYRVDVVESTLPAGLLNVIDPDAGEPGAAFVTLGAGQQNHLQDFGYVAPAPATIAGTLWVDLDADGLLDEPGRLAGVTVVLRDANGRVVATAVTDAAGNYRFPGLPAGTYTVDVTDDANVLEGMWHSTGPDPNADGNSHSDPFTITVAAGDVDTSVDFGYYDSAASIGNQVWEDTDGDGLREAGEPPLSGVVVTLTIEYPNGTVVTMVDVTDAAGRYSFDNLLLDEDLDGAGAGEPTFTVAVATPPSSISTHDATADPAGVGAGIDDNADDPAGEPAYPAENRDDLTNDFGFRPRPAIAVVKSTNGQDANVATGPLVAQGSTVTWQYAVTNTGFAALRDVAVRDDNGTPALAADDFDVTTVVSGDDGDGVLEPGETWILQATGSAIRGQYTNVGTVSATDPAGQTVTNTDRSNYFGVDSRIVVAKTPDTQTVVYQGTASFTITVTNPGNVSLAGVTVSDPRCTTPVTGPTGDADGDGLLAGDNAETWVYTCSTANVTADFTNVASVTGTPVDQGGSPIPGIDPPTASDTATVDVPPDVTIDKALAGAPAYVGGGQYEITYLVNVINRGPATTYDVVDQLRFGAGVTIVSVTPSVVAGGTLAPGFTGQGTATTLADDVAIAAAPATHTYRIVVRASIAPTVSVTAGDCTLQVGETGTGLLNTARVDYEGATATDDACAPTPRPDLIITKTFTGGPTFDVDTGTYTVTYSVAVTNRGDGHGEYDLDDELRFGAGTQIVDANVTTSEPGVTPNPAWSGTDVTRVATDVLIDPADTHAYTITVEADTTSLSSTAQAECATAASGDTGGFLNVASLNDGTRTLVDDACQPIPTPTIAVDKAVSSGPTLRADGDYDLTYTISVTNSGLGGGRYDLADEPRFGDGVTIIGTPDAQRTDLTPAAAVPYPQLATARVIAGGATHTYTVSFVVSISPTITADAADCDPLTGGPRTGLLNRANLTVNAAPSSDDACAPVPSANVTLTKTLTDLAVNPTTGSFSASYSIVVSNLGDGPTSYDLDDQLRFGEGTVIDTRAVTGTSERPPGTPNGTIDTLATWTGEAGSTRVVEGRGLAGRQVDTYTVSVSGSIAAVPSEAAGDCTLQAGEAGTGFLNEAVVAMGAGTLRDDACEPNPRPDLQITKTVAAGPTYDATAGTYTIEYLVSVVNSGGAGTYGLADDVSFGAGVTLDSASIIAVTPSTITPLAWSGTGAIVTGQSITAGATHTFRIRAVATLAGDPTVAAGNCDVEAGEEGTGFLNVATLTVGGVSSQAPACVPVPEPALSITKVVGSGPTLDAATGNYAVTYTITVSNGGDGPGTYDLIDDPAFGDGITIVEASITNDAGVDTAAWNGTTVTTAAAGVVIAGADTHVYTVDVVVDALDIAGPSEATCDAQTGGTERGLRNTATLVVPGDDLPAEACVEVPAPAIAYAKTLDPDRPVVEGPAGTFTITYLLAVTNTGQGPGRYDLVDQIAFGAGITVVSATPEAVAPATLTGNPAWSTWTGRGATTLLLDDQTIAAGRTHTVRLTVVAELGAASPPLARDCAIDAGEAGTGFLNRATLTPAGGAPIADDACTPAPAADIGLLKVVDGAPVRLADGSYDVEYLLTVSNLGDGPGTYDLSDELAFPATVTINSAEVVAETAATPAPLPGWNGAANTQIASGRSLAAASAHVYRVRVNATVAAATPAEARPCEQAPGDGGVGFLNIAQLTIDGVAQPPVEACADIPVVRITMTKDLLGEPTRLADGRYRVQYTITVRNAANASAGSYDLADDLRFGGVTGVTASVTNDASIDTSAWAGSGPIASAVPIAAGGVHVYTITALATIDVSSSTASRDCVLEATEEGTGFYNEATLTVDGITGERDPACGEPDPIADLALVKRSDRAAAALGQVLTYTLTVTNDGPDPATNITVGDVLPAGLVLVAGSQAGGSSASAVGSTLTWRIDALGVGQSIDLTYRATVVPVLVGGAIDPAAYVNAAQITAADQVDPDSDPGTGFGVDDRGDELTDDDESSVLVSPALIGIAKSVGAVVSLQNGSYDVRYDLVIENLGRAEIVDLVVTDDILSELAAINPTNPRAVSGSLTANPTWSGTATSNIVAPGQELPIGASATVSIVITVRPGANLGPHLNQARVAGVGVVCPQAAFCHEVTPGAPVSDVSTNGVDPDPNADGVPSEQDPTPVRFDEAPALAVDKTVSAGPTALTGNSFTVTYRIEVRNTGNIELSNLQLVDDLAATFSGMTVVSASASSATLTVNPSYNGTSVTSLLAGTDRLVVGASGVVTVVVTVANPAGVTGGRANVVVGSALSPAVTQVSDDGAVTVTLPAVEVEPPLPPTPPTTVPPGQVPLPRTGGGLGLTPAALAVLLAGGLLAAVAARRRTI